jgi:hypothetical protein
MDGRTGRWVLLATAVAQAAASPVVGFDGNVSEDVPVVPPGVFFAVWGVIIVGCLVVAVWGLPAARATGPAYRRVQVPLSVAQLGFVAWLVVAASPVVWLTVPIFAVMLAALAYALRAVVTTSTDRVTGLLLGGTLGCYAGWSSAAVWVNLATQLPLAGLPVTGPAAVVWLGACLVAATVTGCVGAWVFRGNPAYFLTVGWALVGVAITTGARGLPVLTGVAVAGLAAVAAVTVRARRAFRRPAAVAVPS